MTSYAILSRNIQYISVVFKRSHSWDGVKVIAKHAFLSYLIICPGNQRISWGKATNSPDPIIIRITNHYTVWLVITQQ